MPAPPSALTFGAEAAQAQTSVTLVSNTGQSQTGSSQFGADRAQPFTTGSNAEGYTLTGVSFPVIGTLLDGVEVRIESSNSNDRPDGSLGALTLSQSGDTVTGTTAGIALAADTTYFVVLTRMADAGGNGYLRTNSDGEDSGAATGWSIGDTSLWDNEDDDLSKTSESSWMIAIQGYANQPPPQFVSATVNGTALAVTFDKTLDTASTPASSAFVVTVTRDGSATGISGSNAAVSIEGATVTAALAAPVLATDTGVKLAYTKPASNALRATNSNATAGFRNEEVGNETPSLAPVPVDWTVESVNAPPDYAREHPSRRPDG